MPEYHPRQKCDIGNVIKMIVKNRIHYILNDKIIYGIFSKIQFFKYSSGSTWAASSKKHNKKPRLDDDSTDDDDSDDGVMDDMLEFFENSDRKQAGLGLVGKLFGEGPPVSKNWKPKLVSHCIIIMASLIIIRSLVPYLVLL